MADEIELKPRDKIETGDDRADRTDHLKPDRTVTGAQVKDAQATNPDNFTSMTEMKGLSEPLTAAEKKAAKGFDSFGIDFGDGTVLTAKGIQAEPGSAEATGTVIDYQTNKTSERSYASGMDWEETPPRTGPAENFEAGTHQAITPETLTNSPEGWLAVTQKIAQLPMDKQFEVIGSGLMAGIEQYQHDEQQRAWGRLIGTVQGTGEVLQGLAKIADFSAACILGDNETAGKMGAEFGTALGQTIVGGVRLFQAADQYLYNIGYTGDYARPFYDIQALGQKLDQEWSQKTPFEQERIKAKLITELVESGAIGAGGAGAIQKASKFTEILDTVAVEAQQLHAAAKPAIQKAANAISNAVDDLVQPVGDTGMGIKMPIPKDTGHKLDDQVLFMKGDKGLPEGVKPSEQVITKRDLAPTGEALHRLEVPEEVFKAADAQGIDRAIVQEKLDKVATAVTDTFTRIGDYNPAIHGSERAYGTRFHEALRQRLGVDPLMHTEASYLKEAPANWGKLGSSRVDIALGEQDKPFASLCLKTLRAFPSAQQERGWVRNLPRLDDGSVIPRIYFKLGE